jgi:ADP-dependent phosphofructokinase/glucokinase
MKAQRALDWQRLYQKAVTESDPEQLPEQIARAEAALLSRLKKLTQDKEDEPERRAIDDALATLRILKTKHLAGWK